MLTFLKGKKTYILASLTALLTLAHSLDYIDSTTYQTLLALLGSGTIATLRSGMNETR